MVVVIAVMCGGPHEHFELWEESEESESGWGVGRWRGGVRVGQNGTADAMSWGSRGINAVCGGMAFAECAMERGDTAADADVFVEDVRGERAPLLAH